MNDYRQIIRNKYGDNTTECRIKMKAYLANKYGDDWADDESPSDLGEAIVTSALTEDQFGNMPCDEAEELCQWVCDNFLGLNER